MKKINVTKTRELDLCVSCEICLAVCPKDAITMEYKHGQFLPEVDDEKCIKCGLCLELCPGIEIDPLGLRHKKVSNNMFHGPCLESYTAYSNDPKIREDSASGGLITYLIIELIKNEEFDAGFVLHFDRFNGKPARLRATNDIKEILNCAKPKYIPASVYNVVKTLKPGDDKKYIIVGTSCQIYGIKKFMKKNNISGKNSLFLGLFCDKTLNFNVIRYFEDNYKEPKENLSKFEFRSKEKYGWPGNSKMYFDSGREIIIDGNVRIQLKKFFQLNRCLFCLDKLNRFADISFGDCYIRGQANFEGKSNMIIRTEKGKQIFDKYSYLFTVKKVDVDEVRKSQRLMEKKDNLEYEKILIKVNGIYADVISNYEVDGQIMKKLSKLQKYIRWGAEYSPNKIKITLFLGKMANKLRAVTRLAIIAGGIILEGFFIYIRHEKKPIPKELSVENAIIVGAGFDNKGAQAMIFTVVGQMKRRFPDTTIYLFSTQDFERPATEKSVYGFEILPWNLKTIIRLLGFWNKLLVRENKYGYLTDEIERVVKNADLFIDISGYALSSQWGFWVSINYLLNIIIAKKYSVPYYIFPQSIGPFDYSVMHKFFLYPLLKLYLKCPQKIFVREKKSLIHVHKFSRNNVEKSYDIVFQRKGYHLASVFNENVHFEDVKVEPNSVGIIPNLRVIERTNANEIYSIYHSLLNRLINAKKNVYILRHSYEDLDLCEKIKSLSSDKKKIKLVSNNLNAIELESVIKQFDFVIASRYHSIVHAYKNGVPALVIGWTTKYVELLEDFNQIDYFFDCGNNINVNEISDKLDNMIQNYKHERKRIVDKMNILDQENIFDTFDQNIY